jgi:hypothetical protein
MSQIFWKISPLPSPPPEGQGWVEGPGVGRGVGVGTKWWVICSFITHHLSLISPRK